MRFPNVWGGWHARSGRRATEILGKSRRREGPFAASQQKQKGAIPVFNMLPAISVNSSASLDGEKKSALASAGVGEAGSLVAGLPVAA